VVVSVIEQLFIFLFQKTIFKPYLNKHFINPEKTTQRGNLKKKMPMALCHGLYLHESI